MHVPHKDVDSSRCLNYLQPTLPVYTFGPMTSILCVYFNLDGLIAVVSSCLTGRVWEGFLWAVESVKDFHSITNPSLTAARTMAGNSDILWLTGNLVAVASDCGLLEVWEHMSPGHALQQLFTLGSHDDMVMSLCHLGKSQRIASGGADSRYMLFIFMYAYVLL